jgi:hypothetical protein
MRSLALALALVAAAAMPSAPAFGASSGAHALAHAQSHVPGNIVLPRRLVMFEARLGLRHRFGRAYERGRNKRLSCRRILSDYWRCSFSFRYRHRSRAGTITVQATLTGIKTTVRVRR